MLIHSMLPLSTVNGPGERAEVWLQGCDLRCAGCWNPSSHMFDTGHDRRCDLNHKMAASATLCFPGGDAPPPAGFGELRQHHFATARAGDQSDSGMLRPQDLCAIGGAMGIYQQESRDRWPRPPTVLPGPNFRLADLTRTRFVNITFKRRNPTSAGCGLREKLPITEASRIPL